MLALGVGGRSIWDVVVPPARAAEAVAVAPAPAPPPRVQLAPLPSVASRTPARNKASRSHPRAPSVGTVVAAMVAAPLLAPLPPPPLVETEPAPVEAVAPALAFDDGNGESIARAIARAKRAAVQDCFERELKRSPDLRGNVTVELELSPPNRVGAVRVSDDLNRPELTRCVTATMQKLQFSGLNEEVSVQLPYALSPAPK